MGKGEVGDEVGDDDDDDDDDDEEEEEEEEEEDVDGDGDGDGDDADANAVWWLMIMNIMNADNKYNTVKSTMMGQLQSLLGPSQWIHTTTCLIYPRYTRLSLPVVLSQEGKHGDIPEPDFLMDTWRSM